MTVALRTLDSSAPGFDAALTALLAYSADTDRAIEASVEAILADVRERGDAAVLEYTRRFDAVAAETMTALDVGRDELAAALAALPSAQRQALEAAAARIRDFHERQLEACGRSWSHRDGDGSLLGQKVTPIERVGIYVPGGKAAYPSSVLMNAVPAKVAGVGELVMVSPNPNALVLAAAALAGVDRVIGIGGAQAIGALAYGTASVPRVDKIVGPGNVYVAEAKRQVFGQVGIDMIAGPSEVLILADDTANPDWLAADLLAQAEHDPAAQSILITDSPTLADAVEGAVERQLALLPRRDIAAASWRDFGAVILVARLADAVPLVDRLAPEHLEIEARDADALSAAVRNAGSIFLGSHTPEAIGDYVGGPNHVLPTARSARFSSGLGVLDFLKRTSILKCDAAALRALGPAAMALARAEGLEAHARSVAIRLNL